jgi:hypothetical protein
MPGDSSILTWPVNSGSAFSGWRVHVGPLQSTLAGTWIM